MSNRKKMQTDIFKMKDLQDHISIPHTLFVCVLFSTAREYFSAKQLAMTSLKNLLYSHMH